MIDIWVILKRTFGSLAVSGCSVIEIIGLLLIIMLLLKMGKMIDVDILCRYLCSQILLMFLLVHLSNIVYCSFGS